ncbi:hypothetical protein HOY80DRAFT_1059820 [Tuber brumale]|nr:hypothetical protein HOY80DRAFT_1059820 [Tuber brumale]
MRQEVSWVKRRQIEKPKQRNHQRIISMLKDAETILPVHTYINSVGERLTSGGLARAIMEYWCANNNDISNRSVSNVTREVEKAISSSTALRWIQKLGFKWKEYQKGVYNDGHERADVKRYWEGVFLSHLELYQDRLIKWNRSLEMESNPLLESGEQQPLIFVTQDECTFNANDGMHYL